MDHTRCHNNNMSKIISSSFPAKEIVLADQERRKIISEISADREKGKRSMYKSEEAEESGNIVFRLGSLGHESLAKCKDVMLKATQKTLNNPEKEKIIFQYGLKSGDTEFRRELASFLTSYYGDPVDGEKLVVTAGATHGLQFVVDILVKRDTTIPVFVEDPAYFAAINILKKDQGFNVVPVPTQEDGINLEAFEDLLKKYRPKAGHKSTWTKAFWSMTYMMTVYNNPTGSCMSPAKCSKIVQLARKYDMLLFVEDVYNMMHFGKGKPPSRLITYDSSNNSDKGFDGGHVLSNGTFSKIFAPGVRLGWIEGSEKLINILSNSFMTTSAGCFNQYTSVVMTTALRQGLISSNLQHVHGIYKDKIKRFCESARRHLPEGCTFKTPQGGFFFWMKLPGGLDGNDLLTVAENKFKVNFLPGERTSPSGKYKNYIRLSISFIDSNDIEEGLKRLGKAIEECLHTGN